MAASTSSRAGTIGPSTRLGSSRRAEVTGGWVNLGKPPGLGFNRGNPADGVEADARMQLFARADDNRIWSKRQTSPQGDWEPAWTAIGDFKAVNEGDNTMVVGVSSFGHLELLALGFGALKATGLYATRGGWAVERSGEPEMAPKREGGLSS